MMKNSVFILMNSGEFLLCRDVLSLCDCYSTDL